MTTRPVPSHIGRARHTSPQFGPDTHSCCAVGDTLSPLLSDPFFVPSPLPLPFAMLSVAVGEVTPLPASFALPVLAASFPVLVPRPVFAELPVLVAVPVLVLPLAPSSVAALPPAPVGRKEKSGF